jgi:hypothetical protein
MTKSDEDGVPERLGQDESPAWVDGERCQLQTATVRKCSARVWGPEIRTLFRAGLDGTCATAHQHRVLLSAALNFDEKGVCWADMRNAGRTEAAFREHKVQCLSLVAREGRTIVQTF